jgi:hypothetical protein
MAKYTIRCREAYTQEVPPSRLQIVSLLHGTKVLGEEIPGFTINYAAGQTSTFTAKKRLQAFLDHPAHKGRWDLVQP